MIPRDVISKSVTITDLEKRLRVMEPGKDGFRFNSDVHGLMRNVKGLFP